MTDKLKQFETQAKEDKEIIFQITKKERSSFLLEVKHEKEKDTIYEGNFGNYYDFEMLNYPLDYDLISFEDKQCFKELFLYKFSEVQKICNLPKGPELFILDNTSLLSYSLFLLCNIKASSLASLISLFIIANCL